LRQEMDSGSIPRAEQSIKPAQIRLIPMEKIGL